MFLTSYPAAPLHTVTSAAPLGYRYVFKPDTPLHQCGYPGVTEALLHTVTFAYERLPVCFSNRWKNSESYSRKVCRNIGCLSGLPRSYFIIFQPGNSGVTSLHPLRVTSGKRIVTHNGIVTRMVSGLPGGNLTGRCYPRQPGYPGVTRMFSGNSLFMRLPGGNYRCTSYSATAPLPDVFGVTPG